MNNAELQKSNANYNATALLERVRGLFRRDEQLLGEVAITAALKASPGEVTQHIMTRIDVLPKNQIQEPPEILDYGTVVFVKEVISREALLDRLGAISEKRFQIGEYTITAAGLGFYDDYEPSQHSQSNWPVRTFNVSFGSIHLPYEQLLHPKLKAFPSIHDAIREFFKLEDFNSQSDPRLGQIRIMIPNLNARIEKLTLAGNHVRVKTSGAAQASSLKLAITYKREKLVKTLEVCPQNNETTCELAFSPTELSIWLVSRDGFVADFHEENQHYSRGANPILPKETPGHHAYLEDTIPEFATTLQTIEIETPTRRTKQAVTAPDSPANEKIRVLISHSGKDKSLAESLIDLLRAGLGLRADQIRCTSVDGYRLPAGVNTADQLRKEIKSVGVLIGLLTPNSLSSTYVLFELGARWGAELFMIPLLAGITPEEMRGPHQVLNALSCETESQIFQLVTDVGAELRISPQSPGSYLKQVRGLKAIADSIVTHSRMQYAAQPREAATSVALAKPNILCLGTETVRLRFESYEGEGFYRGNDRSDPFGAIACFRNEPSSARRVTDADNVRAQIIYRDANGKEIGTGVPRACWVGNEFDMVDFPLGQVHCAILVVHHSDDKLIAPWKERYRPSDSWMGGEALRTQFYELRSGLVHTAEIRLIGEENELLLPPLVFDISFNQGRLNATIRGQ